MPRIEPMPPTDGANAVVNSLLARVIGRRPEILAAFGRLDNTIRFHGLLPGELKEAVRRATASEVGCEYCKSLGAPLTDLQRRESLAVAFAQMVAQGPAEITDGQFDVLREEFTDDEIVELVAFICFVSIAGQMFGAVMGLEAATDDEATGYQSVIAAH
jgi:alkylhydroperoxidase family enzyme